MCVSRVLPVIAEHEQARFIALFIFIQRQSTYRLFLRNHPIGIHTGALVSLCRGDDASMNILQQPAVTSRAATFMSYTEKPFAA